MKEGNIAIICFASGSDGPGKSGVGICGISAEITASVACNGRFVAQESIHCAVGMNPTALLLEGAIIA